jgi:hypothetical protein
MTGEAANNYFGYSVSTAGDVNGDGYGDVIVGAYYHNSATGRAYMYLSSSPSVKPSIVSVKDVLGDQGGYVFINFARSAYDVIGGENLITEYLVEMSSPPGATGFSWSQIGSIRPLKRQLYTFMAATPNDATPGNSGTYYYRVTALTNIPDQFWRSNIISGHSTDNISPARAANFNVVLNGSNAKLSWDRNTESDFKEYEIYKSTTGLRSSTDTSSSTSTQIPDGLDLSTGMLTSDKINKIESTNTYTLLTTTADTTYTDPSAITVKTYYYVYAKDIHGNLSEINIDSVDIFLSANIKVIIEGAYSGGQMTTLLNTSGNIPLSQPYNVNPWKYSGTESVSSIPSNVVDWVLVELRTTTTTTAYKRAAFLKNDGRLVDIDGVSPIKFSNAIAGLYYVVINHRNHLPLMTANKVDVNTNPVLYDIRSSQSQAYGTNAMKDLGGSVFGIYGGDTNGSNTIDATDRSSVWNNKNTSGLHSDDINLNGTVEATDRSIIWNNRNISTQVPSIVLKPAKLKEILTGEKKDE